MYFLKKLTEDERQEAIRIVRESLGELYPIKTAAELKEDRAANPFNHKLEESMENKSVEWINNNMEFLEEVANKLHNKGYHHNYPFTSGDELFDEITTAALEEINGYRTQRWSLDSQIRSFVANRMHDQQWVDGPRYIAGLTNAI